MVDQLSWSLGWENKATKVDGTAAWWRHADGMTVTRGGSSLTNVIWTELVLVAAHSNLHVEDSDTVSHYYHYSASTAPQSRYLWCTMGCARLAGHGRVHPHQLATHVTGYMVTWLHRHGGTLGYRGLVMADTAQLGHPPDVTLFLLMGEAKNIRLTKVFIL